MDAVGTNGPRVLMTAPAGTRLGGVSTYCAEIKREAPEKVTLLTVGSRSPEETPFRRAGRVVSDGLRLACAISRMRPELVQLNPSLDPRSAVRDGVLLLVTRACGCRPVVFFHGWSPHSNEWVSVYGRWLARRLLNRAAAVVVLASTYRERLLEWGVEVPIHVESTLVPRDLLAALHDRVSADREEPGEGLSILVLGRVTSRKGIWTAVEATRIARARGVDLRLMIAGGGPELERLYWWSRGARAEWVRCLGEVRNGTKVRALRQADVLLMPSPSEGMPLSLLEGMAAGLPIVTTKVGGIPDFFVPGSMGYEVAADDPQAMADALVEIAASADLRAAIGAFNRSFALLHFDPLVVWRRLERIYMATRGTPGRYGQESDRSIWYEGDASVGWGEAQWQG